MSTPKQAMADHRLPPELAFLLKPLRLPCQEWFDKLNEEAIRYPECYDNPLSIPPNMALLLEYASRANIANIAKEMARSWGEDHPDAELLGLASMRIWPAATRRGPHKIHLFNTRAYNNKDLLGVFDGRNMAEIRDENGLLVFSEYPSYIRPGRWINTLMMEYSRFLHWRRENEVSPTPLPKPLAPIIIT